MDFVDTSLRYSGKALKDPHKAILVYDSGERDVDRGWCRSRLHFTSIPNSISIGVRSLTSGAPERGSPGADQRYCPVAMTGFDPAVFAWLACNAVDADEVVPKILGATTWRDLLASSRKLSSTV